MFAMRVTKWPTTALILVEGDTSIQTLDGVGEAGPAAA